VAVASVLCDPNSNITIGQTLKKLLFAAALASTLSAQALASTGQIQVGAYSGAGSFADASAYQSAVNAAVSAITAVSVSSFDSLTVTSGVRNYAFKTTIDFGVSASAAGDWGFRAGVDFGKGGAIFIDNLALATKSNDMWWNNNYSTSSQYFNVQQKLASGNHTLTIYGIENCCSGNQQFQFKAPGSTSYKSFSSTDGLVAVSAVPEPEAYAMLLAGLGLMGTIARRRKNKTA
jgi:hypothetical protein